MKADLKEPECKSDLAGLDECPVTGSCKSRHDNERQYYVTNQQTHSSKIRFIMYYYSPTCSGHFCGHLQEVIEEYKQYTNIMTDKTNKWTKNTNIYCTINSVAYYMFRPPTVVIFRKVFLKDLLRTTSTSLQI